MRSLATKYLAMFALLALSAGCGQFYPYEYMSLEETPGAVVRSKARAEFEGLFFGPTIPVEYSIEREGYDLRILIDERTPATNATVELVNPLGRKLVPRMRRGMRIGRARPCGSFAASDYTRTRHDRIRTPARFTFLWITCREADPEELVIAFDVVDESGAATKENLRFELRHEGSYFLRHSL